MSDWGDHHQRIEAALLETAENHRPRADEVGVCGCGFSPWSVPHVVVSVWREGATRLLQEAWIDAETAGAERALGAS